MSSSADRMISVRDLGKLYKIAPAGSRPGTLTESLLATVRGRGPAKEEFWALRGLSFEARRGDVIGLVGHNGAGKSTLLKLLSRITEPTEGAIDLYGRVGSLLEVGTGFHPELTGRENIYLNGAILGMSRSEIDRQFDAIVDFAGPRVALHLESPVKRYSSGMTMRLGFAVAANLDPEILIVDEVLAVGDAEFQKKCLGKMQDVATSGRTVFFVSHNLAAVTALCTRALLLQGGKLLQDGPVGEIAAAYQLLTRSTGGETGDLAHARRLGSGAAQFVSYTAQAVGQPLLYSGGTVQLELRITAHEPITDAVVGCSLADSNTYRLVDASTAAAGQTLSLAAGESALVRFTFSCLQLKPGLYTLGLALGQTESERIDDIDYAGTIEVAVDDAAAQSVLHRNAPYTCPFTVSVQAL